MAEICKKTIIKAEEVDMLKNQNKKLKEELSYYKGFYEGVKEITTLLGDGTIEINHNININLPEDIEEVKDDEEGKSEMKVAVGKFEGEKAEKFIKLMKELGVE